MSATRTDDLFTQYSAASVVNGILEDLGIDKVLPPQMFYNYTSGQINKGKKPMIPVVTVDGKVRITNDDLFVWVEKYLNKNHKVSLADLAKDTEEDLEENVEEEVTVS